MKEKNSTFRMITLVLFCIAIGTYYVTALFAGNVAMGWLIIGIVQTLIFCAVFFRDSRRRVAISIILSVVYFVWCLAMAINSLQIMAVALSFGAAYLAQSIIYTLFSLLAGIFALAAPRKYNEEPLHENI